MKTIIKNVYIYCGKTSKFEAAELELENLEEKDVEIDGGGAMMVPSFVSLYGELSQTHEDFYELYSRFGYSGICERIEDIKALKNIESGKDFVVVSENLKLLDKLKKDKRGFKRAVWVDFLKDTPEVIDQKVIYAKNNGIKVYSRLYSDLNLAGEIDQAYNKSPIEVARDFGLLDGECVFVDNVVVDKDDMRQSENSGFVLSPIVNMNEGRGFEPINLINNYAKNVGFGAGKRLGLDMFENMRAALAITRASMNDKEILGEEKVFEWATGGKPLDPIRDFSADFLFVALDEGLERNITNLVRFSSARDIVHRIYGIKN